MEAASKQQAPAPTFPVPFTLEQLREDMADIYLQQLRTLALFAPEPKVHEFAGKLGAEIPTLFDTTFGAKDYELAYEDIEGSEFAQTLEWQYQLGILGLDLGPRAFMAMDTSHTWVAAHLMDVLSSEYAAWMEMLRAPVERCLLTCRLANARHVLEGGEDFLPYASDGDDGCKVEGALTVRQVALLAGMEEMSVRTAMSRKGPNQLASFKEGRRTLIRIADAKSWLQAKNLYVPLVTPDRLGEDLDLAHTKYADSDSFFGAINNRYAYQVTRSSAEQMRTLKEQIATKHGLETLNDLQAEHLLREDITNDIAAMLDLPPDLFGLRAREAVLLERLAQTTKALTKTIRARNSEA